ncbi:hypothetical protein [Aquirufa novilacunae]|uniref:Uncharacterized protein n=1 Tax=Aquirufa novilacunae TaxID=3139305 RepID=A0ABW8U3L7_9BACT
MNDLYQLPKLSQWIISLAFLLLGLFLAIFIIEQGSENPLIYVAFILYVPISQFLYTPLFKLTGGYTYYSPMLLGYMVNEQQIDLHSGTSFDYLFVFRNQRAGVSLRNKLLMYHCEGLLNIISQIENKRIPESVQIVGTSYFFNERTLQKLGFQIEKATLFYRANLFINFIDLFWMYSVSHGKVSFPALWDAKKAAIKGDKLVAQKKYLEMLYSRLK